MSSLKISKPLDALSSMKIEYPYMMYKYIKNNHCRISIDFLAIGMHKKFFRPKVVKKGLAFSLGTVIPRFFPMKID